MGVILLKGMAFVIPLLHQSVADIPGVSQKPAWNALATD
jgi:hypothetical protein